MIPWAILRNTNRGDQMGNQMTMAMEQLFFVEFKHEYDLVVLEEP